MLRDLLRLRIPEDVQLTREYKAFLSLVRKANITDLPTLKAYLGEERAACTAQLKSSQGSNQGGTQSRHIRTLSKRQEFLKLVQDRILPYLG
jgi:hypothetical protein